MALWGHWYVAAIVGAKSVIKGCIDTVYRSLCDTCHNWQGSSAGVVAVQTCFYLHSVPGLGMSGHCFSQLWAIWGWWVDLQGMFVLLLFFVFFFFL